MSLFRHRLLVQNSLKNSFIKWDGLVAAWSAKGKTNQDADRDILRDLTVNGRDMILYGLDYTESNGYVGDESLQFNSNSYGETINTNIALDDFTIISKREEISNQPTISKWKSGNSCFTYEFGNTFGCFGGGNSNLPIIDNKISWGNANTYNGIYIIKRGNSIDLKDTPFRLNTYNVQQKGNLKFYCAYVFNRSLPAEEVKQFINKYIDPNYELPTL